MQKVDTAELRRLHQVAVAKGVFLREEVAFSEACKVYLPALLDELEAAREAVSEESNRWVSVIRGIDPEALCDFHDEHGSQEYLKAWLDARDRRMKGIGAAEKLERLAQDRENGGLCRRLRVLLCDYDHTDAPRDMTITRGLIEAAELLEIAAQLRQEAEDGK